MYRRYQILIAQERGGEGLSRGVMAVPGRVSYLCFLHIHGGMGSKIRLAVLVISLSECFLVFHFFGLLFFARCVVCPPAPLGVWIVVSGTRHK